MHHQLSDPPTRDNLPLTSQGTLRGWVVGWPGSSETTGNAVVLASRGDVGRGQGEYPAVGVGGDGGGWRATAVWGTNANARSKGE